jgi:hypothetical protein
MNNIRKLIALTKLLGRFRNPSSGCAGVTGKRLVSEIAVLESLERDRIRFKSPLFGKKVEDSIIWRELADLELQEIDEHIGSI